MKIKAKIEIEDHNNTFAVTSSNHTTILEALNEIINVAESQVQSMETRNRKRRINERYSRYYITS
jgi:ribosomal protein L23